MPQVPGATRALEVLRLLSAAPGPMTAQGIARALTLPRSSTYHLLDAMRDVGFVLNIDGRWGLGVAAFEVGAAYARHDPLVRLAAPMLRGLGRSLGRQPAVAYLAVLHGAETLYVAKHETGRLGVVTEVGVRLPAALTASGRAMLAAMPLPHARATMATPTAFVDRTGLGPRDWPALRAVLERDAAQGWSEEDGYITEGFASLAVPVRNHVHLPVAALGVTFASAATGTRQRESLVRVLRAGAHTLSQRLGERAA